MGKLLSNKFSLFLGILLILNIVQAYFTPLIYDETYYWYYSQNMAWGYFDHPPMVAVLAKLSGFLFKGEIGVRLLGCLMGAGTLSLLWSLVEAKNKERQIPLFFLLAFSMVLFNAYGFLTLPDTPLLFFSALFLWLYKRFLHENTILIAILLGICMACLLYSKYHAVLVIFFVFLSDLKLVFNKYAWLAVFMALAAYSPHFYWLTENNFVSVKYHLFERPNQPYEFDEFTLGYLLNLIVNFGLLFPWFYWALFKTKSKDSFQKSLLYLSYGIILFFFLSSFHRRAQAQWVIAIFSPMLLLIFNYFSQDRFTKKWLWRIVFFGTVLIFYTRAWLVYHPLIPFMGYETHGPKEWVETLSNIVGDTPVVFENSYRRAPMYSFYSGKPAFSLNNIRYRRNQYSIDSSEYFFQHKKVAYVTPYASSGEFSYVPFRTNRYYGWYLNDFQSFRKLKCLLDGDIATISKKKQTLRICNPYNTDISLDSLKMNVAYLDQYKDIIEIKPIALQRVNQKGNVLKAKDTTVFRLTFPEPEKQHPSFLKFSISENGLISGLNSESIKVTK